MQDTSLSASFSEGSCAVLQDSGRSATCWLDPLWLGLREHGPRSWGLGCVVQRAACLHTGDRGCL
ncbi:Heterogeneous nuclear ribonucleoprotein 1 [Zea mays]|uniref:Heterogeneous nuclear ribonucleoprotein 1 n=1 Tax=Zea mays TaxID=4577 RepID=A0A1D6GPQ7_MAIZE|nr:Heterogeneous nuclear ribonucleoprotein 1 [Zea mays]